MSQMVFCQFENGATSRTIRFNGVTKGVQRIYLHSITAARAAGPTEGVIWLEIADVSMMIDTENQAGYPVPLTFRDTGATLEAGTVFPRPLLLAQPARGAIQQLRITLRTSTGAVYPHTTVNLWILLETEKEIWSGNLVRDTQYTDPRGTGMSGIGTNDWRLDDVPTAEQILEQMAKARAEVFSKDM